MPSMSLESIASLLREAKEIVVFSGAGLSADSGIPTFRDGATGLWNNVDPDEVASIKGFLRQPRFVWNWLRQLKHLVDQRLQHLAFRAEPETIVDELRIARHQLVLEVRRSAIECQAFYGPMRGEQDRAAGRLIDTSALHADETVLDEIDTANAIVAPQIVECGQQCRWAHLFAI